MESKYNKTKILGSEIRGNNIKLSVLLEKLVSNVHVVNNL